MTSPGTGLAESGMPGYWKLPAWIARLAPGAALVAVLALAAAFLAGHYGGPVTLYALLLGMAFNFLATDSRMVAGIDFCIRTVLRTGIALLGTRVAVDEVAALGIDTAALVVCGVGMTLLLGSRLARWCGLQPGHAWLSAGSVAICGASAAMAIAAVLPGQRDRELALSITIAGATGLSTVAMVLYPVLAAALGLDHRNAGIFLGASIHDVAQVVAAGYVVSEETGHAATVVKLMRVALLAPVVFVIALFFRRAHGKPQAGGARIPAFLVAFLLLMVGCALIQPPAALLIAARDGSTACIALAVAALGVRTAPAELFRLGLRPLTAMALQSALLAAIVLAWLHWHPLAA